MAPLELKVHHKARRTRMQQKLLLATFRLTITRAGLAFAPDSYLLKYVDSEAAKGNPTRRMRQALQRLEAKGLLKRAGGGATLTARGKKLAKKLYETERLVTRKPRVWDGKWRIVIFDIWERRRASRNKLRSLLQKIGFKMVQHSVWVYPYDCEELLAFIRTELRLGGVLYLIAEGIEHDKNLRVEFDLPETT